MSSAKRHENVRMQVNNEVIKIVKEVLERKQKLEYKPSNVYTILRLLEKSESLPLLVTQEVKAGNEERWVDIAFSGEIIFEIKSSESEFNEAIDKAKEIYLKNFPKANYFVLTNWDSWQIYKIGRENEKVELKLEYMGKETEARYILERIISGMKEYKILPIPENIEKLFTIGEEELIEKLGKVFNELKDSSDVKPLYEAYSQIISQLYKGASKELIEDLFVRHTLMHMIALSSLSSILNSSGSLEDYCSGAGLNVEVGLPYLNWWKITKKTSKVKEMLNEILREITARVSLIDWERRGFEDVFRQLYEVLVEPDARRKIGEYYTPLWLVELILNEFEVKDKIVLDPFCGSGTFLVEAFHKKVMEGEELSKAFHEVIGFDINPLAIAIARAELIIAYMKYNPNEELYSSPHVYHTDSIGTVLSMMRTSPGGGVSGGKVKNLVGTNLGLEEIEELKSNIEEYSSYISSPLLFSQIKDEIEKEEPAEVMKKLAAIEHAITKSVKLAMIDYNPEKPESLAKSIRENLEKELLENDNLLTKTFYEYKVKRDLPEKIAKAILKYQGNSIWSLVYSSLYIPMILRILKPHIIVTNPPWIPTTEFNAPYSEVVREKARELLENIGIEKRRAASIVVGGDVASIALHKALNIAKEGVGFIMNREQSFYAGSSMSAGILLTYAVLRDAFEKYGEIKLIDLDYDAFEHGIIPAVVVAKKSCSKVELFKARIKPKEGEKVRKNYRLEEVELSLEKLGISYDDYVEQSISYFREDSSAIADLLDVNNVIPKGLYIMGLFGGEEKKGKKKYAGIVLENFRDLGKDLEFKFSNTSSTIREVPKDLLEKFEVRVYKLIYVAQINPFWMEEPPLIILSKKSENLKEFIKSLLSLNRNLPGEDKEKIENLIDEVKQSNVSTLNVNSFYVFYRGKRAFTACVLKPYSNSVMDCDVAAIECKDKEQAYYYVAVLNYLAHKVLENKRTFARNQFAKPCSAIIGAKLSWNDLKEDVRSKIAKLSEAISTTVQKKKYSNQAMALKDIEKIPEFQEIEQILDSVVNKEKLMKALDFVSGKTTKKT